MFDEHKCIRAVSFLISINLISLAEKTLETIPGKPMAYTWKRELKFEDLDFWVMCRQFFGLGHIMMYGDIRNRNYDIHMIF